MFRVLGKKDKILKSNQNLIESLINFTIVVGEIVVFEWTFRSRLKLQIFEQLTTVVVLEYDLLETQLGKLAR
jgi:hypothetical protein